MQNRFEYHRGDHAGIKAMRDLETHLHARGLEASLLELVKMRAAQINGCAYCLDMHRRPSD